MAFLLDEFAASIKDDPKYTHLLTLMHKNDMFDKEIERLNVSLNTLKRKRDELGHATMVISDRPYREFMRQRVIRSAPACLFPSSLRVSDAFFTSLMTTFNAILPEVKAYFSEHVGEKDVNAGFLFHHGSHPCAPSKKAWFALAPLFECAFPAFWVRPSLLCDVEFGDEFNVHSTGCVCQDSWNDGDYTMEIDGLDFYPVDDLYPGDDVDIVTDDCILSIPENVFGNRALEAILEYIQNDTDSHELNGDHKYLGVEWGAGFAGDNAPDVTVLRFKRKPVDVTVKGEERVTKKQKV